LLRSVSPLAAEQVMREATKVAFRQLKICNQQRLEPAREDLALTRVVSDSAGNARNIAMTQIFVSGLVIYVAVGLIIGLAFMVFGVTRVQPAALTVGARILLLPGATALWPLVLRRWLKARGAQ
jgi:hypothetical protein